MTDEEAKAKRRARIRTVVTWGISLVALALVVKLVPFRDVGKVFASANPLLLGLAVAVYATSLVFWALRWRTLLSIAGVKPSLGAVVRISIEAQAGGIILPAAIAGDALRVAYARDQNPGSDLAKIVASIFADRIVGLVTLSIFALVGALAFHIEAPGALLIVLAAIPIGAAVGYFLIRMPGLRESALFRHRIVARVVKPMLEYAGSDDGPVVLLKSIGFSLLVSFCQLLVIRIVLAALGGVPSSEAWVVVGTTMAFIVAALPAAPGGWGTTDAAYVFFFSRAGIEASTAVAVCLTYRVFWYALAAVGALLNVSRRKAAG